jgi:hypothetical protein
MYQTVGAKSAHAAAAKRVRSRVNAVGVRLGMILRGAKRLYVHAVRVLPFSGIIFTGPIFTQVVDARC